MTSETDNQTTELREKLTERGVEWRSKDEELGLNLDCFHDTRWQANGVLWCFTESGDNTCLTMCSEWNGCTPEQAIAATLGRPKAKSHPYGYEPDTGAFDCTRCECGCINDISATYCNDCGGEIEIDMHAEKEIYHTPRNSVFAEKHDDGSLEFCERRYVPEDATHGTLTAEQVRKAAGGHYKLRLVLDVDGFDAPQVMFDWQAIADELNAELGSGTCEIVLARLVDVAAKVDIDSCAEILECVEAIRKVVER